MASVVSWLLLDQPTTKDTRRSALTGSRLVVQGMLEEGVYLAPSQFEAGFMSLAHTEADIDATIEAAKRVFAKI